MLEPRIHDRAAPAWLRRVRDRLEAQVGQHFSLLELATDAGVHPAHLAASFRRHYGQSVGDFIATRRLNEAAKLLSGSDTPVGEIATMLGYADQSHFCRAFKSRFTLAPSRYRQSAR
jgi:AraC family transcriptional regulator